MNEMDDQGVRNAVAFVPVTSIQMRFSDAEAARFDRWLAKHDAEGAANALNEATVLADSFGMISKRNLEPYWEGHDDAVDKITQGIRTLAGHGTPESGEEAQPETGVEWEYGAGLNGPRGYRRMMGIPAIPAGPWLPVAPEPSAAEYRKTEAEASHG